MNILDFIKERLFYLISDIFITLIICVLLSKLNVSTYAIILCVFSYNILFIVTLVNQYISKNRFIKNLNVNLESLSEKYLLSEIVEEPNNIEDRMIYYILKECNKSMTDRVSNVELENREYREFIELWVHEVKTPIASSKLVIENHRDEVLNSLEEELNKIEEYIDKALFYARSSTVEKDFLVNEINLEMLVNSCLRKDSIHLIEKKVYIIKENLNVSIYADEKWLCFIIHQIIANSLKYFDKDKNELKFIAEEKEEAVELSIIDNGMGMDEKSVVKAFDKGFTGAIGREHKQATGIGLYLCKKLALKLGLNIRLASNIGEGTKVTLVFPKNSMTSFK